MVLPQMSGELYDARRRGRPARVTLYACPCLVSSPRCTTPYSVGVSEALARSAAAADYAGGIDD